MDLLLVLIQAGRGGSKFRLQPVNYAVRAHRLPGRSKIGTFAGTPVQLISDGGRLSLGGGPIGALRQIPTERAIRVFVGAALPGAMGTGKEDADREVLGSFDTHFARSCARKKLAHRITRRNWGELSEGGLKLLNRPLTHA